MAVKFADVSYKDLFQKVNFKIDKGHIVSVVGKSGSGKTTIFDLIIGQDLNFYGKITLGKKIIDNNTKSKQLKEIREHIFYLKQDYYNQLFNINILEDINYYVGNANKAELYELLKAFGLDSGVLKKHHSELSNGEIKKALLIIMLLSDRKILLLDDVTADLDLKGKKTLIKQLKKVKRDDKVIILSSSDADFLLGVADAVLYINDNKIDIESDKYNFFCNRSILNKCSMEMPKILEFKDVVLKRKKIKLLCRDNINDLIKDIYRNAK
ncbi:MAG: ATP-binding cassette domain-containing protein [Bacilli bacterium]|nr:ATP-binding cassette domain-containing protein [Bacilli bacterium]